MLFFAVSLQPDDLPIDSQVTMLLGIATRKDFLAMAKPTWQAWY